MRRRWIRGAVAVVAGVALLGVAPLPAGGQSGEPTGLTVLATRLTGEAEVDGAGTPGQGDPDGVGLASVVLAPGWSQDVCAQLIVTGIDDVTMAHIHVGAAGTNGPIVVPLPAPVGGASGGCVAAEPDVLEAIAADPAGYYVNVHTVAFPAGAVRGQLAEGPSPLTAGLNGASERTGTGVGFAGDPDGVGEAVVLADPEGLVCVAIEVAGVEGLTMGHIHEAGLRANGPIRVPFTELPVDGSSVECIAAEVALAGQIAADPSSFYVNLHTGSSRPGPSAASWPAASRPSGWSAPTAPCCHSATPSTSARSPACR